MATFSPISMRCSYFADTVFPLASAINWGEPAQAPRVHDVYCTCVRACVHASTCEHACRQGLPGNEWSQCGWGMRAVWDLMGGWERLQRDKNACQCSGEAITTKKRFVPEKFLPCAGSYEGKVCAWTAVGAGVGHELVSAAHSCTCYDKLAYKGTFMSMTTHWAGELNTWIHAMTI